MAPRRISRTASMRAATPRQVSRRLAATFVLSLAAALFLLARTNTAFVGSVRSAMTDVLAPAFSVLSAPADAMRDARLWLSDMATIRAENAALKTQVSSLSQWQQRASALQSENDALRKLIRVVPEGKVSYVAARVVSESSGPYVRSALIHGGTDAGIQPGQAAIGAEGLVGRVVEAGQKSARVLLITDINSHVPVVGEHSRERSIADGNNSSLLTLDYVQADSKLTIGERLLTSGDGGIFPPGVPVGIVTAITNGTISVQPLIDWSRMEYVNIAAYDF